MQTTDTDSSSIVRPGFLPEPPKLSVCMIVRDEENVLPRCLNSIRDIADETIIVDTGSRDNTIDIAEHFGADVYRFTWCDDFSAARNETLVHATGDWILQIDADEELVDQSVTSLRETILDPWILACMITIDNGPAYPDRFFRSARLFRNHPQIKYSRPYHETIQAGTDAILALKTGWKVHYEPDIILRHYGYESDQLKAYSKLNRELRMLESHMKKNPDDHAMGIRLVEIYKQTGRYHEAVTLAHRILESKSDSTAALHILGTIYHERGELGDAAAQYKKALAIDNTLPWVHYHLGSAYQKQGKTDRAEAEFRIALSLDPNLVKAHVALGVVFHVKDMLDEAQYAYQQALNINPDDVEALFNLGIVLSHQGNIDEAKRKYGQAIKIHPRFAEAHNNLALLHFRQGNFRKAVTHCDKAVELGFQVHPQFLKDLHPYRG